MRSWQALTLNGVLRFTMKRHGKKPLDLHRLRAGTRHPPKMALAVPSGYKVDGLQADGIAIDVADRRARAEQAKSVVLYFHGGGYIFGSPKTHRQALIAMSRAFDAPAYAPDYRLAPEHPFPAAVEDAERTYLWLLSKYPKTPIVLAGDSAGAGLAVATAIGIRDAGIKMPSAIIGFSPYTDLAVTGESVQSNAKSCAMFTPRGVREAAALYMAGADPKHPRASPLYADLAGLPPMLLFASQHELLRDDTLRLTERARAAGVGVELVLRNHLPHVWPVFIGLLPEAREAFEKVREFAATVTAES
jgi:acetyl esterase/lipase